MKDQPIKYIDNTALYPVLTKREYFAALAMQGMISAIKTVRPSEAIETPKNVAGWAVMYADELLKQLEK